MISLPSGSVLGPQSALWGRWFGESGPSWWLHGSLLYRHQQPATHWAAHTSSHNPPHQPAPGSARLGPEEPHKQGGSTETDLKTGHIQYTVWNCKIRMMHCKNSYINKTALQYKYDYVNKWRTSGHSADMCPLLAPRLNNLSVEWLAGRGCM